MDALPGDAKEQVAEILAGKDLTQTSLRVVRAELEARYGQPPGALDALRETIKQLTTAEIARIQAAEAEGEEETPAEQAPASSAPEPAAASSGKKRKSSQADEEKGGKTRPPGPTTKRQQALMSRKRFRESATHIALTMGTQPIKVMPRVFSTGSCGWYATLKVPSQVDGHDVMMHMQISATVIGSKAWAEE